MKVLALFLIVCMVTISALPGRAVSFKTELKKDCCNKPGKNTPCNQNNNDCSKQGLCNILTCGNCSFLKTEPISIAAVLPIIKQAEAVPYDAGNLSGFSLSSWRPPKV